MVIAIQKLFAQLLFWLYELLDTIFEMFAVLCGIEMVETTDADAPRSLIEIFLESSAVTRAFLLIVVVAVFVAAVSTIVAVIKNAINMKGGERKSHAKTVGQGFGSIIISLSMALVMIVGISMSNIVLQQVYEATSPNSNVTPASILFDMCVGKDYELDYNNPQPNMVPKIDPETGLPMFDLVTGEPIMEVETDYEGNVVYTYPRKKDPETGEDLYKTGWRGDHNIEELSKMVQTNGWSSLSPDEVFGVHKKVLGLFEDADKGYKQEPMVEMETFNFFLAYLVVVIMLVAIVWSMLGLVKRIYDLVLLFMALPLISATIPLDDGARFKQWRDSVVSKVILAYGVVLSINIFLLITPLINSISFDSFGWTAFVENLFKAFMLIGGALAINGGQLLFARLFGSSAEESREMAHAARALFGGAMAAGGILRGAKNLVVGGTNKYGRETKGIMRGVGNAVGATAGVAGGVLGLGGRAADAIGKKVGGSAYANSSYAKFNRGMGKLATKPLEALSKTAQNVGRNTPILRAYMPQQKSSLETAMDNLTGAINGLTGGQQSAPVNPGSAASSVVQAANSQSNIPQQGIKPQDGNKHAGLIDGVIKPKNGEGGAFKPPKK